MRAKEDEHKAYIESLGNLPVYDYVRTNVVKAEVTTDYRLRNFKLNSGYSFEDMLKMNDEQLIEVATDTLILLTAGVLFISCLLNFPLIDKLF